AKLNSAFIQRLGFFRPRKNQVTPSKHVWQFKSPPWRACQKPDCSEAAETWAPSPQDSSVHYGNYQQESALDGGLLFAQLPNQPGTVQGRGTGSDQQDARLYIPLAHGQSWFLH